MIAPAHIQQEAVLPRQLWRNHVSHPALAVNNVAVITGGASGIGLAAAMRFARLGLRVCIADVGADRLAKAAATLIEAAPDGAAGVMTAVTDVSNLDDVKRLEAA